MKQQKKAIKYFNKCFNLSNIKLRQNIKRYFKYKANCQNYIPDNIFLQLKLRHAIPHFIIFPVISKYHQVFFFLPNILMPFQDFIIFLVTSK